MNAMIDRVYPNLFKIYLLKSNWGLARSALEHGNTIYT